MQDENMDIENEKEPDINKKKIINVYFLLPTHVIFLSLLRRWSTGYKIFWYFLAESTNVLRYI